MNIQFCFNGDIEMIAENGKERDEIRRLTWWCSTMSQAEKLFVRQFLPKEYSFMYPEEVGALTDAPLIFDGKDVFGYMEYQVTDFLKELAAGRTVHWTKARA